MTHLHQGPSCEEAWRAGQADRPALGLGPAQALGPQGPLPGSEAGPRMEAVPRRVCLLSETLTPNLSRQTGSFSSTPCTWAVAPARSLVAFTQNQLMLFSLRPGPWCFKPCADFVLASTLLSMGMWLLCYNISGFEKANNAIKTRAHSLGPSAEPTGPSSPAWFSSL